MADDKKKKTLEASDIVATQHMSRRGAIGIVAATVLGGAAAAVTSLGSPSKAHAQANDADDGSNGRNDPPGHGRTGCSDSDSGNGADSPDHGRHCGPDSGANEDRGPSAD